MILLYTCLNGLIFLLVSHRSSLMVQTVKKYEYSLLFNRL